MAKPEDLKRPFTWERRHIALKEKILYIPERCPDGEAFTFPGWEAVECFGNSHPVRLEYCSGNGAWIANKAISDKSGNWVAVEKKFPRVQKIWSKIKNYSLENLMVFCGEAFLATKSFIPSQSITEIFINFPDPWPKKRHAKNRLIKPEFIHEVHRILQLDGTLWFVSDDENYVREVISLFQESQVFRPLMAFPHYVNDLPGYGSSFFEDLWREKGKLIFYQAWVRS